MSRRSCTGRHRRCSGGSARSPHGRGGARGHGRGRGTGYSRWRASLRSAVSAARARRGVRAGQHGRVRSVALARAVAAGRESARRRGDRSSRHGGTVVVLDDPGPARVVLERLRLAGVRRPVLVIARDGDRADADAVLALAARFGPLPVAAPPLHRVPGARIALGRPGRRIEAGTIEHRRSSTVVAVGDRAHLGASRTPRPLWSAAMFLALGDTRFDITTRALVMGILNRTPDSFYDGGQYWDFDDFLAQGRAAGRRGCRLPRRRRGEGRTRPRGHPAGGDRAGRARGRGAARRASTSRSRSTPSGRRCSTRRFGPGPASATTSAGSPTPATCRRRGRTGRRS